MGSLGSRDTSTDEDVCLATVLGGFYFLLLFAAWFLYSNIFNVALCRGCWPSQNTTMMQMIQEYALCVFMHACVWELFLYLYSLWWPCMQNHVFVSSCVTWAFFVWNFICDRISCYRRFVLLTPCSVVRWCTTIAVCDITTLRSLRVAIPQTLTVRIFRVCYKRELIAIKKNVLYPCYVY